MTTQVTRAPAERTAATRSIAAAAAATAVRIDPVRVLRQHQWKLVIAAVLGLFFGVAAKLFFDQTYPLYSGTVLFELKPPLQGGDKDFIANDPRTEEAVERLGQTESTRIMSRALLLMAMNSRDIETTTWSKKFLDPDGKFKVEEAVDELLDDLTSAHRRRTQYFYLNWSTHDPQDIPIVLNKIAQTYIEIKKQTDENRFTENRKLFANQQTEIERDLSALSREIGKFITDNNIKSLDLNSNDISTAMQEINRNIGETQGQKSIALSRLEQTQSKMQGKLAPSSDDIKRAEEDPVLMRMQTDLNDRRIAAQLMSQKFGPTHNERVTSERVLRAAEAEYDAAHRRILENNLNADFKRLTDQVESYAGLLKEYQEDYVKKEQELNKFSANKSELNEKLDRQKRLQESRSKTLDVLSQLDVLKLREDSRAVAIAQIAMTPREKSFPRWSVMVPLGCVFGLVLVLAWAFLREFMDQRVRYTSDLAGMGARLLGVVPDLEDDPTGVKRLENAIREAPQSVIAESLRQAAAQILKQLKSGSHRSVLVVGAMPGSGASAIITNLAESMASAGKRVLILDANFRRPGLAVALGTDPNAAGLGEVLAGKVPIESVVQRLGERIDFLNAGAPEHRVYERLSTPFAETELARLRENYDIALIDAPPAVVAGDALVIAGRVDATVLVVRAFQEQRGLVSRLVHQLNDMPSSFLGIILNRPRSSAGGYFRKNFEAMASYAGKS